MNRTSVITPLGPLNIESGDWSVMSAYFTTQPYDEKHDHPLLIETVRQIAAYFSGDLRRFDVPIEPAGTVFQRHVWECLSEIPFGETLSYSALQRKWSSEPLRALVAAVSSNPMALIIPCHRVVGSQGQKTGYPWGAERKSRLLIHEQQMVHPDLFTGL
jgi:methylated-DNA-[protein]-cysteine S-methyltransferase